MEEVIELKPCPFCGSPGVAVVGSFVRCGSCGAVGPYGYTDLEAIDRWNARPIGVSSRVPARNSAIKGEAVLKTG